MDTLTFLRRLLAIAQAGLTFGHDVYDRERYTELRDLALEQLATLSATPLTTLQALADQQAGYPTPKVDVRGFIRRADRVLLVQDAKGEWALPGGYAEVGWSPRENVAKEVREETGLTVTVGALRAIYDTAKRPDLPYVYQYYKLIFACTPVTGTFAPNPETTKAAYFALTALPPLSEARTTRAQLIQLMTQDTVTIE
ncbi:NUDIX hydrolase [Lacticaseibacillus absianus]|uniref:NUDIX hydrolase n=1 Tax=Lacticaseibacillus absianus TaxID=2729623 RepID=UPI0015CD8F3A|nr:NUDIX hydrolase [Lacticaseibacillus absianus]